MAQAARLNLRMQKEIKLLQDDPPHGVSLNENGLSSLLSIEAKIEGPEGTVYAKGVFILKIEIPERYPFEPPNVTFVTPIYHPNIDNGGRICLDILKLPPKGAWQPSLNIATVLMSIGLLLSEPNPDDGLMAEISREYKYNRQVFDVNAQVWTEKYASPTAVGAIGWSSVDAGVLNTQVENTESQGSLPKSSKKDCEGNQRKMRLLGQKLSLKSGRSEADMKTVKQDPVASHLPSMAGSTYPTACFSDVSGGQNDTSEKMSVGTASGVVSKIEYQGNNKNSQLPSQELSVTSAAPSKTSDGNDVFVLPNHFPTSSSHANDDDMQSSHDILENSFPRKIGGSSDSSYQPPEGNRRNIRTLGLKLSLKSVKPEKKSDEQKENMAPNHLPPQLGFNKSQKRPLDAVSRKQFSGGPALVQENPITEHQQSNTQVVSTEERNQGRKKLCSLSRRLSLKSQQSGLDSARDKGYKAPNCSLRDSKLSQLPLPAPPAPIPKLEAVAPNELPLSEALIPKAEAVAPSELPLLAPTVVKSEAKTLGFAGPQKDANSGNSSVKQNAVSVENVVVSDSEDSEDEREKPPRSRLSLMRRRLAAKQKT